ncbi:sensor histidine kinase [Austwickia chelonae]|uniref:sensor histidine kinase n=1 Tax=Austwickia chelonae TaxID=100225 RepID=UPI001966FAC9|nr:sensor histidine kinase [Austwickia chelonae]
MSTGMAKNTDLALFRKRRDRIQAVYACAFLIFLLFPLSSAWRLGGLRGYSACLLLGVFTVWYAGGYLGASGRGWATARCGTTLWLVGLAALCLGITALIGASGLNTTPFITCGAAALLPTRPAVWATAATGTTAFVIFLLLGVAPQWAAAHTAWTIFLAFTVWGSTLMFRRQEALMSLREEKASLAVELERHRMARDLHDILGHSLTVVVVKTELAGRLVEADPARARRELADVERLSREALAEVRSTVAGYRTLSLATELSRARKTLVSVGIGTEISGSPDDVPIGLQDVFAWTVREGVTNVVRHSGARSCRIAVGLSSITVHDDGHGVSGDTVVKGNGLTGLSERARQVSGQVTADSGGPGFTLCLSATTEEPS